MNKIISLTVLVFSLSGCFGGISQPSHYYLLSSTQESVPAGAVSNKESVNIQIGPLDLARYLDRTNMVTRTGQFEVRVSEFDYWAEPLSPAMLRVMAQNIQDDLNSAHVVVAPWPGLVVSQIQIPLSVERFDCNSSGSCGLRLRWAINGEHERPQRVSDYEIESDGSSIASKTAALSGLLDMASKTIGAELKELIRK